MTEQHDDAVTPRESFWDEILKFEDDVMIPITVQVSDEVHEGAFRVGDVRETFADPHYREIMRQGAVHAQRIRAEREALPQKPLIAET